jgi:hypothetical protein
MAIMTVNEYLEEQEKQQSKMKIKMNDVWNSVDNGGMIVAGYNDICPIFKDKIPYKSVTVICQAEDYNEVCYWLDYVHGGGISKTKTLTDGRIAIRSNYMCW